jgi:hypothetical protein
VVDDVFSNSIIQARADDEGQRKIIDWLDAEESTAVKVNEQCVGAKNLPSGRKIDQNPCDEKTADNEEDK